MTDAIGLLILYTFPLFGGVMVWRFIRGMDNEPRDSSPVPHSQIPPFLLGLLTTPVAFFTGYYLCGQIITAML